MSHRVLILILDRKATAFFEKDLYMNNQERNLRNLEAQIQLLKRLLQDSDWLGYVNSPIPP